jgi:hypothetical protein
VRAIDLESAMPPCSDETCGGSIGIIKTIKNNHEWIGQCKKCLKVITIEQIFDKPDENNKAKKRTRSR